MTDRIAFVFGLLIIMAVLLDLLANGGQALLFLAFKFVSLIDWVAFWR